MIALGIGLMMCVVASAFRACIHMGIYLCFFCSRCHLHCHHLVHALIKLITLNTSFRKAPNGAQRRGLLTKTK